MTDVGGLTAAEAAWLEGWAAGPTEGEGTPPRQGDPAADLRLPDHTGRERLLSEFWASGPALVMFWRHFGCGCGLERARRLREEYPEYLAAGLTPVIVGQGDPTRANRYRDEQDIPCAVLSDPGHRAYRAYGLGHWTVERVLFDAPPEYWRHERELGAGFQRDRRAQGRPPVDDPWRAVGEFVVGVDGRVRLPYAYQYCEDFPDPRVLTVAARLS
jgi:peroxiredoxin